MKKIEVKVRYLFEGTYTVAADDRSEARTMVTRDCGLVLGGNIPPYIELNNPQVLPFGIVTSLILKSAS